MEPHTICIYAGAAISYRYSDILDIRADMQYTPQSADHGVYNGIDRPRWIVNPSLTLHPVKALSIGVNYEYRGVRNAWSAVISDPISLAGSGLSGSDNSASGDQNNSGGTAIGNPASGNNNGSGGTGIGNPGSGSTNNSTESMKPISLRLPDITRLNAHAAYTFTDLGSIKSLTIGIDASNLLNRREALLPGLPSEGLTLRGSIGLIF